MFPGAAKDNTQISTRPPPYLANLLKKKRKTRDMAKILRLQSAYP